MPAARMSRYRRGQGRCHDEHRCPRREGRRCRAAPAEGHVEALKPMFHYRTGDFTMTARRYHSIPLSAAASLAIALGLAAPSNSARADVTVEQQTSLEAAGLRIDTT